MMTPHRVQMRRTAGWRKPANTVYVGRPTKFGNPFRVPPHPREEAIALYEAWLQLPENASLLDEARRILRGKNLACWCPLGEPCHAGVLLRLANGEP